MIIKTRRKKFYETKCSHCSKPIISMQKRKNIKCGDCMIQILFMKSKEIDKDKDSYEFPRY